ncbi:hypothetical protein ruthe_02061 [Rubellimicrobium thermophilum DSM 16684]|uniref:Uncharacterized protein n=1 Tax=Rubellimicrobium thermophilum DSM 16684 TaxID=1123069 RepID=S9QTM0_9RHOB|nr:hypothetical protein [Rubellimicrobium thermophilum]EPX84701.1 hypothetical protein ruthe_02061 [Rubellimicrobium thermophilum DSM 16684]
MVSLPLVKALAHAGQTGVLRRSGPGLWKAPRPFLPPEPIRRCHPGPPAMPGTRALALAPVLRAHGGALLLGLIRPRRTAADDHLPRETA